MSTKKQQDPKEIKDLMREVEDDMAFESLKKGLRRYGLVVAVGVVAILLLIGGGSWYRLFQDKKALLAEDVFISLVYPDTEAPKGAVKDEDLDFSTGYQTLVAFAEGQRHLSHDRQSEAAEIWQKSLKAAPLPLRNLLVVASGSLAKADAAKGAPQEPLQEPLKALAENQTSSWRFLAQEARAFGLYAAGDKGGAKALWEALSKAQDLPAGVRDRTEIMLKSFL
ncbi:MAG: hypothetical protein ACKO43_02775 [Alphaproteobacteria bacterium]